MYTNQEIWNIYAQYKQGIILNIIIIIIVLTHSKAILKITVEIEPHPAALDFKDLFQYSSRSKQNCLLKNLPGLCQSLF